MFAQMILVPRAGLDHGVQGGLAACGAGSVTGLVGLLVALLLIYFAVRYRRRPGDPAPPPMHGNTPLEVGWTIAPLGIFMASLSGGRWSISTPTAPPMMPPSSTLGQAVDVEVSASRDSARLTNCTCRSAGPVQVDADLRGRDSQLFRARASAFTWTCCPAATPRSGSRPTKAGTYHLFCSQYCGTDHSTMVGTVHVLEPTEYQEWLHLAGEGSPAMEGRKMFIKYRCLSCHSADKHARAPVLEELYDRRFICAMAGRWWPTPITSAIRSSTRARSRGRLGEHHAHLPRPDQRRGN